MKYKNKHWRIERGGFSWNADTTPFFVLYRNWLGLWFYAECDQGGLYKAFANNMEALAWINERAPRSVIECPLPPVTKPENWALLEEASGRYGREKQNKALVLLAAVKR